VMGDEAGISVAASDAPYKTFLMEDPGEGGVHATQLSSRSRFKTGVYFAYLAGFLSNFALQPRPQK